jgi:hypothetical protein
MPAAGEITGHRAAALVEVPMGDQARLGGLGDGEGWHTQTDDNHQWTHGALLSVCGDEVPHPFGLLGLVVSEVRAQARDRPKYSQPSREPSCDGTARPSGTSPAQAPFPVFPEQVPPAGCANRCGGQTRYPERLRERTGPEG